jgi:hypothetical protein
MVPAQLTAAAATYYTAPANTRTIIKKLTFTNPVSSAAARIVTVHLVPSGGAASDTNTITSQKSIAIGQTWECFEAENHILSPGDFVQALADAATDVTMMMSGLEVT